MEKLSADEFAGDTERWMNRIVGQQEPIMLTAPNGTQVVVLPAAWWIPAGDPLPELPDQDAWSLDAAISQLEDDWKNAGGNPGG